MAVMSAADVAQTIQLIIAPVVLITACALIQNAILGRYAAIGQYMRSLTLERLQLLRSDQAKTLILCKFKQSLRMFSAKTQLALF